MKITLEDKRQKVLELMRQAYTGHMLTNGNVPTWHHLDRVSRLLEMVLGDTREGLEEEREAIVLAALGHDALEDTDLSSTVIEKCFGPRGFGFIQRMTNMCKENHPDPSYVLQVVEAEEAVRLIKLADLYDNYTSVTHGLFVLGTSWAEGYFLPIVRPMSDAVLSTDFITYPRTASRLKEMVRIAIFTLGGEIMRYKMDDESRPSRECGSLKIQSR